MNGMRTEHTILTRQLPKTGVSTSYRAGDDGTYEAGWWKGLKNGVNRNRFVAKTINGDDVVIDLATGLMWAADGAQAGCNNGYNIAWDAAIDYANALDFAGFTDWRMPNVNELVSIVNWGSEYPATYAPFFTNISWLRYWTATTPLISLIRAWDVVFGTGFVDHQAKTSVQFLRCVRGGV